MISVLLGLVAALCWSVHDLVARSFAGQVGPLRMALFVLMTGAALLMPIVVWQGTIWHVDGQALLTSCLFGAAYALALGALLKAFSLAPVSVVGPLTAGYPALVVVWGIMHGLSPSLLQWAAIAAILAGAVIVGRFGPNDGGLAVVQRGKVWIVLASALAAVLGFAASIVLGQDAAKSIGEVETTFISRFPAALLVFAAMRMLEPAPALAGPHRIWRAVSVMALCDVIAVCSINAATHFPNKELGAMAISGYGGLSALFAMIFLKESVSMGQWLGIAMICCGVAGLAIP